MEFGSTSNFAVYWWCGMVQKRKCITKKQHNIVSIINWWPTSSCFFTHQLHLLFVRAYTCMHEVHATAEVVCLLAIPGFACAFGIAFTHAFLHPRIRTSTKIYNCIGQCAKNTTQMVAGCTRVQMCTMKKSIE